LYLANSNIYVKSGVTGFCNTCSEKLSTNYSCPLVWLWCALKNCVSYASIKPSSYHYLLCP